jgi:hypothetical protein
VFRAGALAPQVPIRHGALLEPVYVVGNEALTLRLQFGPLSVGKRIQVAAGKGFQVNGSARVFPVSGVGECVFSGQLAEGFDRGHVIFYCEGQRTVLPILHAAPTRLPGIAERAR